MNWSYLFKHWFSTLLLGPVILQIMMYIYVLNPNKIVGLLEIYPISLIFGLIFSTPTYILYGFIYYYLVSEKIKYSKVILILFAVVGVIITTLIIKGSMMLNIAISYSFTSIITGLFFKLSFNNPENK